VKLANSVNIRVFCKEDEDKEAIAGKLKLLLPFDIGKEKNGHIIEKMKRAGFSAIFLGIENPDPEALKGMNKKQMRKLSRIDIEEMLGTTLTPSRVKCATLPLEVLQKAMVSLNENYG